MPNNALASTSLMSVMSRTDEIGIAIPLDAWQDPQGNVILRYSREEYLVYFGCWTDDASPADYICLLTFHNAWAVCGFRLEWHGYKIAEHKHHSEIFKIENSKWLSELTERRLAMYPNWKHWDAREYFHYVVSGHDNYYDIIATGFEESIIPESEAGELAVLIQEA